jgi:hypothetical protein
MADFVAVDFKPLKGGGPDADDIKAAEFTLYNMAVNNNLAAPIHQIGPYCQERDGVSFYTIEWHANKKVER